MNLNSYWQKTVYINWLNVGSSKSLLWPWSWVLLRGLSYGRPWSRERTSF